MHRLLPVILLAFVVAAPVRAQKGADRDEFFKNHEIVHLDIEIGPKEMDALRREPRKYVMATLKEGSKGETTYQDIGVHLKGAAGSFRGIDDKAGLTLNMDKYERENYFHGMDKFHLSNSIQDPSYVTELLCGELFRAAGVPASRCSHAIVSINGKRRGFYYLKEGYDNGFLKQHFKSKNGNFYDGGFLREIDQPLQILRGGKESVKPYDDLKKLVAAAREPDPKQRFKKMEQCLAMDQFITYLALEVLCWDWDGYPMNRNNYRIYHDPDRDKLVFIPSGMDQMWHDPNGPMFPNFNGEIARNLLGTPEGRTMYVRRVEQLLKTVFVPEKIHKRLDELQAVVQPALASVDPNAGRDYPNQINRIRGAVSHRVKVINAELDRAYAEEAKKIVREIPRPITADVLRKHVDFTKVDLLLFKWHGSKGDRVTLRLETDKEGPLVVFRLYQSSNPEKTINGRLFAIGKNARWRVAEETSLKEPLRITEQDLDEAFPAPKVEKK